MATGFEAIRTRLLSTGRIRPEDALELFSYPDLRALMDLADEVKRRRHGDKVYWVNNRQINYTNVCVLHCSFCAFSKIKKDSAVAYDWDHETVLAKAAEAVSRGARELHIVGGLHPDHGLDYYLEMLSRLRTAFPDVDLKAFTAVEIMHFASLSGLSPAEVLSKLKSVGLDSLPGGGAEILVEDVRRAICGPKESGAEWLSVHREAHKQGIHTNATMLFGHVEDYWHRVEHMRLLRSLQDETGGFLSFIPLVFHPENNALGRKVGNKTPPEDRLRTVAVARIFLDNFPHIKAYWVHLGIDVALQAIHGGASDFDGTIIEERITQAAGAETPNGLTADALVARIREVGLTPVERDALYHEYTVS